MAILDPDDSGIKISLPATIFFVDLQGAEIVPASQPENLSPLLHEWKYYQHFLIPGYFR